MKAHALPGLVLLFSVSMAFCDPANPLLNIGGYWSDGFGAPPEGQGLNTFVDAIELMSETSLCVGGAFTVAGGIPVNCIARWDGSGWSPLGSGMNHCIYSIEVNCSNVYAGGELTTAGGVPASRMARWNMSTSSWTALGSCLNQQVCAIRASGQDIFAGGWFIYAGGIPSHYFARWTEEEVGTGEAETEPIPQGLRIISISPNPSTAAVQIALQSPGTPDLSLDVCDITGHIVFSRELGSLSTGQHDLHWNGCDSMGAPLFPGVYFARVSGGGLTASATVMLVR